MKYKIGDRVKVREDLVVDEFYGGSCFISDMDKFKGKIVTIKLKHNKEYRIEEMGYFWTDEMFEGLVEDKIELKVGDKVEIIRVDCSDKTDNIKIGDVAIVISIINEWVRVKFITGNFNTRYIDDYNKKGRLLLNNQLKLVEEEIEDKPKPKYVKCINNNDTGSGLELNKIYEIKLKTDYGYEIIGFDDYVFFKYRFIEVDSPTETIPTPKSKSTKGVIKYKIKGDVTTVKLNGKVGKATRNSIDEPDNSVGLLIATCRVLSISEEKIQDIIDILFDSEDTKAKYGCENAVMKNDIARALSILDKYKE